MSACFSICLVSPLIMSLICNNQSDAYHSHAAWMAQCNAVYASLPEAAAPTVATGGPPAFWSASPSSSFGTSPPASPTRQDDGLASAFGRALDFQDFADEPVTRGGNAFSYQQDYQDDEAPAYRSIFAPEAPQAAPAPAFSSQTDWLHSMPPLLQRQNARHNVFGA